MARAMFTVALLLMVACSTTRPAPPPAPVDPTTDPTIIGAIDEAVTQGTIEGQEAARTGRRIGRVAGVLAAVLGGPQVESVDDMVDRYRNTRDAVTITAAAIGAAKGATEGAKRGLAMDLLFADLHAIEGLEVFRPYPDQIDVHIADVANRDMLRKIVAVLKDRNRAIDLEGDDAQDTRDALVELGMPEATLRVLRNDEQRDAVLHIY